jgi:hypothetical protein
MSCLTLFIVLILIFLHYYKWLPGYLIKDNQIQKPD